MLHADGKDFSLRPLFHILALNHGHLLVHRPDVSQELLAPLRDRHAGAAPLENPEAHFLFHGLDGVGQAGLGHIELLGRLADGGAAGHHQQVFDLLECHTVPFPRRRYTITGLGPVVMSTELATSWASMSSLK